MKVEVNISGIRRIADKYTRRVNLMGGDAIRVLLKEQGAAYAAAMRANIASFTPGRVRDLTPAYKAQKQKKYGHVYPILHASGALVASITYRVMRRAQGAWAIEILFIGDHGDGLSNKDLAGIHASGKGHMPRRDFTAIPANVRSAGQKAVKAFFKKGSP